KRADQLMAQLAEIRVADTACGSGGFLIKVLRAFWQQYQRIDSACAWVGKILKPANGELYLAELPPNVQAALAFRRRHHFDLRARYIEKPMRHEPLDEALALREKVRADFVEHFQTENLPCEPGGFAIHFWPCWFDADGKPRVGQASRLSPASSDSNKSETGAT